MISVGEKIIGILGGMGPEATADLFLRILRATPVEKDQDHFRIIIDSLQFCRRNNKQQFKVLQDEKWKMQFPKKWN